MHRLAGLVTSTGFPLALIALAWVSTASAGSSVFVFPHIDANQPWYPVRPTSFGTLLRPVNGLPDDPADAPLALARQLSAKSPAGAALAAGRSDRAVALARDEARQANDAQRLERALATLGVALIEAGQPADALEPLRRAIGLQKRRLGPMHPELAGTYSALGMALEQLAQHRQADDAFGRAQGILQRNEGILTQSQLGLILARSESWRRRDEAWQSEQLLRAYLRIVREHWPADTPQQVAAALRVGRALTDMNQYRNALTLYRSQLLQLAGPQGEDNPLMAGILSAMAQAFLLQGGAEVDRGRRLTQRAARITERFSSEFSVPQRVEAQLLAGDWRILFGQTAEATDHYAKAWELASRSNQAAGLLAAMSKPKLIFAGPDVTLEDLGPHWGNRMAYTEFRFWLSDSGRPTRVAIERSNLHKTSRRAAVEMIRKARFRPAVRDGRPIDNMEMTFNRIYDTRVIPHSLTGLD